MKKNAMMKIAAILMVAVLLTTCAISSTFAKYVTSGKAADSARVAKWGVNVTVSGDGAMFAEKYGDADQVASAETGKKVVAPGTSNSKALSFTVSGKPEVDTVVTINDGKAGQTETYNYVTLTGWDHTNYKGVDTYCPLVFTLKSGETTTTIGKGYTYTPTGAAQPIVVATADQLAAAVNYAIAQYASSANYEANAEISATFTLGWEWAFESNGADADAVNKNDTALGNIIADANVSLKPTIEINFNVIVAQASVDADLAAA